MGFGDLFKKIFGPSAATPVDERALSGASEDAVASSLEKLADGERGWIPLAQAALLFSTEDRQYAFGELDDAGKNRLAMPRANLVSWCRSRVGRGSYCVPSTPGARP